MGFYKKSDPTVLFSYGRIFKQDTPRKRQFVVFRTCLDALGFSCNLLEMRSVWLWGYTVESFISGQSRYSISTVAPHWSFGLLNRVEWRNTVEIKSRDCQDTRDSTVISCRVSEHWCPFSGKISCIERLRISAECGHSHRRKATQRHFLYVRLYGAFSIFSLDSWDSVPAKDA